LINFTICFELSGRPFSAGATGAKKGTAPFVEPIAGLVDELVEGVVRNLLDARGSAGFDATRRSSRDADDADVVRTDGLTVDRPPVCACSGLAVARECRDTADGCEPRAALALESTRRDLFLTGIGVTLS